MHEPAHQHCKYVNLACFLQVRTNQARLNAEAAERESRAARKANQEEQKQQERQRVHAELIERKRLARVQLSVRAVLLEYHVPLGFPTRTGSLSPNG